MEGVFCNLQEPSLAQAADLPAGRYRVRCKLQETHPETPKSRFRPMASILVKRLARIERNANRRAVVMPGAGILATKPEVR